MILYPSLLKKPLSIDTLSQFPQSSVVRAMTLWLQEMSFGVHCMLALNRAKFTMMIAEPFVVVMLDLYSMNQMPRPIGCSFITITINLSLPD